MPESLDTFRWKASSERANRVDSAFSDPAIVNGLGATGRMTATPSADRFAWLMLGFGLIATWWLPYLSQPILTFYKEWLFVLALGLGGLSLGSVVRDDTALRRHPLVLAAGAIVAVLLGQSLAMDGVWQRATLMASSLGFFAFTIVLGRSMLHRRGGEAMPWLAGCLVIAALGSCFFAALQLNWVALPFPFVLARDGDRLYGNVAQANHFADLLWIGCVGVVLLYARGKLRLPVAAVIAVVLQAFSVFSGSRMVWAYVAVLALLGAACWFRRTGPEVRRFGAGLLALAGAYVLVVAALTASGVLDTFGISSAEKRMASASAEGSMSQRLWFWRAGIDAAAHRPLLGVGVGRYPGHAHELAMASADSPLAAADSQAHNVFIQLAAELGVPLALLVFACLALWLVLAWRRSSRQVNALAAFAMLGVILVHANLEHPLGYLYFLGLFGLLVGHLSDEPAAAPSADVSGDSPDFLRLASFAVLAAAAACYVLFNQVEKAMQVVLVQVQQGAPPQPSRHLAARLEAVPAWSPYGDYAELIALITALPTEGNSNALAARCDRSVLVGPAPHLLARCATAFEVAGKSERASYFANSLCRIYPHSVAVLIQSMEFVEQTSPAAANLRSSCVDRVK